METILSFFKEYTDVPYMLTFMFFSYLVATYFGNLFKMKTVFVVLIIAAIIGVIYVALLHAEIQKVILSYAIGTSLHETFFKWIGELIKALWMYLENLINAKIG